MTGDYDSTGAPPPASGRGERTQFGDRERPCLDASFWHLFPPDIRPLCAHAQRAFCSGGVGADEGKCSKFFARLSSRRRVRGRARRLYFLNSLANPPYLPLCVVREGGGAAEEANPPFSSCTRCLSITEVSQQLRQMENWRSLIVDWETAVSRRPDVVKLRLRAGVPSFLRGSVWQLVVGVEEFRRESNSRFTPAIPAFCGKSLRPH